MSFTSGGIQEKVNSDLPAPMVRLAGGGPGLVTDINGQSFSVIQRLLLQIHSGYSELYDGSDTYRIGLWRYVPLRYRRGSGGAGGHIKQRSGYHHPQDETGLLVPWGNAPLVSPTGGSGGAANGFTRKTEWAMPSTPDEEVDVTLLYRWMKRMNIGVLLSGSAAALHPSATVNSQTLVPTGTRTSNVVATRVLHQVKNDPVILTDVRIPLKKPYNRNAIPGYFKFAIMKRDPDNYWGYIRGPFSDLIVAQPTPHIYAENPNWSNSPYNPVTGNSSDASDPAWAGTESPYLPCLTVPTLTFGVEVNQQ